MTAILLAAILAATGQKSGTPSPGSTDASANSVKATGSTTPRTLAARARDVVNALDEGMSTGASAADNTTALNSALTKADGGVLVIPAGSYDVTSAAVTITKGLAIEGDGATLNAPSMTKDSTPILRIHGTATTDVEVRGLTLTGPRLSTDTNLTGNTYATGFPSGLDVYTARKAKISGVRVSGTFHAGIETHGASDVTIETCSITNIASRGISITGAASAAVVNNTVDDVGVAMAGEGYGITAASRDDTTVPNDAIYIAGNTVSRTKGKGIDVHDGLSVRITGNKVIGFGMSGIYAVSEDAAKVVRDVLIEGNQIRGDTTFVASATHGAIEAGMYGSSVQTNMTIKVSGNQILDLSSVYGFDHWNGTTAGKSTRGLTVVNNTIAGSTLTTGIHSQNNDLSGTHTMIDELMVRGNVFTGSTITYNTAFNYVTHQTVEGNSWDGAAAPNGYSTPYGGGLAFEGMYGGVATIDLVSANLSADSTASAIVDVEVLATRHAANGSARFHSSINAYRNGGAIVLPVGAALAVEQTVLAGTTAPTWAWVDMTGNVGKLQLTLPDAYATYLVRMRAVSQYGTVAKP